ncbi:MAG: hypothetical protein HOW73_11790 [Polyangiaceae bacterium]|nr:hypothetical protein [Polyangiaceae bacterium]
MAAYNKFQAFLEHVFEGVHNFSSDSTCTITVALTASANAPVATNSILSDLTQISYTNLSARVVSVSASSHTTGTYKLVLTDLVLSASGGAVAAFRYVVLYNDDPTSPADPLICWFDYGSALTLADGESLTLDFDATNGVLQAA